VDYNNNNNNNRGEGLLKEVMEGRMKGKRARGRP